MTSWTDASASYRQNWQTARALDDPGRLFQLVLGPLIVAAVIVAIAAAVAGQLALLTFPLLSFVIASVPILRTRRYDLASPWTFVWLSVAFGVTLRSIYIVLGWPTREFVDDRFLRGQPPEFFLTASVLIAVGVAFLALGYSVEMASRARRWPGLLTRRWGSRLSVSAAVTACWGVALISTIAFVSGAGGFDPELISVKRNPTFIGEAETSLGHFVVLANFGMIGALVQTAYYAHSGLALNLRRGIWLLVLYGTAAMLPFYVSSRGRAVWPLILGLSVWYLSGRRIRVRSLLITIVIGLLLFQVMTELRLGRDSSISAVPDAVDFATVLDPLILNNNLLEVPKTAFIIDAVPEPLEFAFGETLVSGVVAPVPRALWANKPQFAAGKVIGSEVYGYARAGVPPAFVAEMYWNFHVFGVVIGGFVAGFVIRRLYESFRTGMGPAGINLMYTVTLLPFTFTLIGGDFGRAWITPVINGLEVLIVMALVTSTRDRPRFAGPGAGRV